ncbi:unnamed protein product [Nippostrongylus brasiliensis]|uniref:Pentatricopeptide repeat-containing protein n=1 Tax=Nippostrongylus brasiliensis TaxID=27835 RepID=A0A158QY82_NIPBR|nr:unnamed protein product [Nippostrongylus brasiliensis]
MQHSKEDDTLYKNIQTSNVSEARGLIVDMLANRDLPPNVVSCLRAVATLLNPHTPLSLHSINDFGLPCVVENPYSGEQLIVSNNSAVRAIAIERYPIPHLSSGDASCSATDLNYTEFYYRG